LVPYSEQLSQWSLANATLTSNDAISPDGYQNADKIVTTSAGCDVKYTNVSVSASTTYTASFWVKLTSGSGLEGRFYDNTNSTNIEYYTYDSQLTIGEWSRVTRTFTTPSGCTNIQVWYLASSSSSSVTAHFWGFQCEAGSYATSYIPTLGSSVTRLADLAQKTSASALIGQTEGTIFWEIDLTIKVAVDSDDLLNLDNGSFGDTIYLYKVPDGRIACDIYVGSAQEANFILPAASVNVGIIKMALGYANNNSAFFVNGVQVGTTDTSCTIPAMNRIQLGNTAVGASFSRTSQAALYTTRLSNAELQSLTSL
jgi:hypothetical protein